MKLEPGNLNDKWVSSCIELIKSRMSSKFMNKHSIKSMNFIKIWKIINKKQKIVFENIYDHLVDINVDDKKYYDFFFLHLDNIKNENDILEYLFNKFHNEDIKSHKVKFILIITRKYLYYYLIT
jgi:hypothetical protein